jgi:hypothetical protein
MSSLQRLHRPRLRDVRRAVAAAIVIVFAICAVSIAYAAGRHASHDESSPQSRLRVISLAFDDPA